MRTLEVLVTGLIAAFLALPVAAQNGPGPGAGPGPGSGMGMGPGGGKGMGMNCPQANDPAACEAHRAARQEARKKANEACKDLAGTDRRQCMKEAMIAQEDCSKAPNPGHCEAWKKAAETCKDKTGPAMRDCMQANRPVPDCKQATDPKRCELVQQAYEACKEKIGPERQQCMREQRKPQPPEKKQ